MVALLNPSQASQLYQQQQQVVQRLVSFFLGSCVNRWHHPNSPGWLVLINILLLCCSSAVDIFILGIANLIGGLPVIYHNVTYCSCLNFVQSLCDDDHERHTSDKLKVPLSQTDC